MCEFLVGTIVGIVDQRIEHHNRANSGIVEVWESSFNSAYDHGVTSWMIEEVTDTQVIVVLWNPNENIERLSPNNERVTATVECVFAYAQ